MELYFDFKLSKRLRTIRGFDSRQFHLHATTLEKLQRHKLFHSYTCASDIYIKQYSFVLASER